MQAAALALVHGLMQAPGTSRAILSGHCEVAERIAARLGLPEAICRGLGQLYERWDGRGLPAGLKGAAIAMPVRIVTLAQDAILLKDTFGMDEATVLIGKRRGSTMIQYWSMLSLPGLLTCWPALIARPKRTLYARSTPPRPRCRGSRSTRPVL